MFQKPTAESIALEEMIIELELKMTKEDGDSEDYATMLNRLERLKKLQEKNSPKQIDPNTLIIAGANILGIIILVAYEHGHVIAGRAVGFVGKLR